MSRSRIHCYSEIGPSHFGSVAARDLKPHPTSDALVVDATYKGNRGQCRHYILSRFERPILLTVWWHGPRVILDDIPSNVVAVDGVFRK